MMIRVRWTYWSSMILAAVCADRTSDQGTLPTRAPAQAPLPPPDGPTTATTLYKPELVCPPRIQEPVPMNAVGAPCFSGACSKSGFCNGGCGNGGCGNGGCGNGGCGNGGCGAAGCRVPFCNGWLARRHVSEEPD